MNTIDVKKSMPYPALGLVGALLWCGAVLLREVNLVLPRAARLLIGIAPNFGVVWLLMALFMVFGPLLLKREITPRDRYLAMPAILVLLLLSELVHYLFMGSDFDWMDMLASVVALVPLVILNAAKKEKSPSTP